MKGVGKIAISSALIFIIILGTPPFMMIQPAKANSTDDCNSTYPGSVQVAGFVNHYCGYPVDFKPYCQGTYPGSQYSYSFCYFTDIRNAPNVSGDVFCQQNHPGFHFDNANFICSIDVGNAERDSYCQSLHPGSVAFLRSPDEAEFCGYTMNQNSQTPTQPTPQPSCPTGQYMPSNSMQCVPIPACSPGQTWDSTSNQCVPACSQGYVWDSNSNQCLAGCPQGKTWDSTKGMCLPVQPEQTCDEGYVWDVSSNQCVSVCHQGQAWNPDIHQCANTTPTCSSGFTWDPNSNQCVSVCPPGQYMPSNSIQCMPVPCPPGQTRDSTSNQCVSVCFPGYKWDSNSNQCVSVCSPGQTWDPNSNLCLSLPQTKFKEPPVPPGPLTVSKKDESFFDNLWQKPCTQISIPLACKDITLTLPTGKHVVVSFDGEAGWRWTVEVGEVTGIHLGVKLAVAQIPKLIFLESPWVMYAHAMWTFVKIQEGELKSPIKISTYCPEGEDCSLYHFFITKAVSDGKNDPYQLTAVPTTYDTKTRILNATFDNLYTVVVGTVGTSPSSPYTLYQNSDYGFSIQYPNNWYHEEKSAQSGVLSPVAFFAPTSTSSDVWLAINYEKDSTELTGLTSQQILNKLVQSMAQNCANDSFQSNGFTCYNPQFKTNVGSVGSYPKYTVISTWVRTLPNSSTDTMASVWMVIPAHNDLYAFDLRTSSAEANLYLNEMTYMTESFSVGSYSNAVQSEQSTQSPNPTIPSWIKNTAKWWSEGSVGDDDFIKGVQYLIQQGIISVPTIQESSHPSQGIPSWIKNTAKWWSEGQLGDADFIKGVQYLVQNGIVVVQQSENNNPPQIQNNNQPQIQNNNPQLNTALTPARDLTATWSGSTSFQDNVQNPNCSYQGTAVLTLNQNGNDVAGTWVLTITKANHLLDTGIPCLNPGTYDPLKVIGTVSSSRIDFASADNSVSFSGFFTTNLMTLNYHDGIIGTARLSH